MEKVSHGQEESSRCHVSLATPSQAVGAPLSPVSRSTPTDGVATEKLLALCKATGWRPAPEAVRRLVEERADVMFMAADMDRPIFCQLLYRKAFEACALCLSSPCAIDFTVRGKWGWTPLHHIAAIFSRSGDSMLRGVVAHIRGHPDDRVDWARKSSAGHECITTAADRGHLSDWWRLVKELNVAHYAERCTIAITLPVQRHDWEQLGSEDCSSFNFTKGITSESAV